MVRMLELYHIVMANSVVQMFVEHYLVINEKYYHNFYHTY